VAALFFGDSGSPLFGVWLPPSGDIDREHGVVLCPPIAQEHVRSHWALRQAASVLSRAGFHSLRFDWFGVGDSAGELRHASIARWKGDLENASQELRDSSGVRDVSFVGLRFGGTIAALAATDQRPSSLVLWDPIVRGRDYITSLRKLTADLLADPIRYWNQTESRRAPPNELVGFDFGEELLAEIEKTDLLSDAGLSSSSSSSSPLLPSMPLCVLRSSENTSTDLTDFVTELRRSHPEIVVNETELSAKWADRQAIEELLLPGDALRKLTEFLESSVVTS
jgi:pimeloyl-ACP methyl ester carboxylesterase